MLQYLKTPMPETIYFIVLIFLLFNITFVWPTLYGGKLKTVGSFGCAARVTNNYLQRQAEQLVLQQMHARGQVVAGFKGYVTPAPAVTSLHT